jgi:hypothetical protein
VTCFHCAHKEKEEATSASQRLQVLTNSGFLAVQLDYFAFRLAAVRDFGKMPVPVIDESRELTFLGALIVAQQIAKDGVFTVLAISAPGASYRTSQLGLPDTSPGGSLQRASARLMPRPCGREPDTVNAI